MNTFLLLTIAASIVLLIVEGAFLARLPAEKIHALLRRSILVASALVILALVFLGTWHWMFVPVAVLLPFIDLVYVKLRNWFKQLNPATARRNLSRLFMQYRQRARAAPSPRAKAHSAREQQNNAASRHVDMTRDQALHILGLNRSARPSEIKDAHRRLMRIMHPDRGGNSEQAAQVNRAKDVLIGNN